MSSQDTENGIRSLYEAYANDVYRYARLKLGDSSVAKDVVQEVFLRAFRSWGKFRGDAAPKTWLMSITRNYTSDLLRKKRAQQRLIADYTETELVADRSACIETKMMLEEALLKLKHTYREVFILRHVERYSVEETAQIMGFTKSNVKTTDQRALAKMRGILGLGSQGVNES